MSAVTPAETLERELGSGFGGQLIGAADAGYDDARALFNAMIDKRPAVIARCATPEDVARVIGFARQNDLPVAIRGGGHNGGGLRRKRSAPVAGVSGVTSIMRRTHLAWRFPRASSRRRVSAV